MIPGVPPLLAGFLDGLLGILREGLGPSLAGVSLVGSAAAGHFDPATSDVDVLVVVGERLDGEHADAVANGVAAFAERACPVRGLELVVYLSDDLRPPRWPQPYELNLNAGPRMARHVSRGGDPEHWFLLDVAMAFDHTIPLMGTPLPRLAVPPKREDVAAAIRAALDWYGTHHDAGVDAVLNACRSWQFLATGRWTAKPNAARWAEGRPEVPQVVEAALRARGTDQRLDPTEVSRFLASVRAEASS